MTREEAKEMLPYLQAFSEGKEIEMRSKNPRAQLNGWEKMGYDYAVAIATQAEIENGAACGQLAIICE